MELPISLSFPGGGEREEGRGREYCATGSPSGRPRRSSRSDKKPARIVAGRSLQVATRRSPILARRLGHTNTWRMRPRSAATKITENQKAGGSMRGTGAAGGARGQCAGARCRLQRLLGTWRKLHDLAHILERGVGLIQCLARLCSPHQHLAVTRPQRQRGVAVCYSVTLHAHIGVARRSVAVEDRALLAAVLDSIDGVRVVLERLHVLAQTKAGVALLLGAESLQQSCRSACAPGFKGPHASSGLDNAATDLLLRAAGAAGRRRLHQLRLLHNLFYKHHDSAERRPRPV
eukprot:scaffold5115_cov113-Isochrysis_galbana.AAC.2